MSLTVSKTIDPPVRRPPYGLEVSFQGDITQTATLYIPQGSLSAFKNDPKWGQFENIVELPEHE